MQDSFFNTATIRCWQLWTYSAKEHNFLFLSGFLPLYITSSYFTHNCSTRIMFLSLKLNSLLLLSFGEECLEVSAKVVYHTFHRKAFYFKMKNSGCLQGLRDGRTAKNSLGSVKFSAKYASTRFW